jgi:hypothetical protein
MSALLVDMLILIQDQNDRTAKKPLLNNRTS